MNSPTHFHLVGIKGQGMTALTEYLLRKGKKITGSDTEEKFFTDEILKKLGIKFKEGFRVGNLPKSAEVLIHSTAFLPATNPEIKEAEKRGLKILTYPEALAGFFNEAEGIAVAGTHGKTTTSALLSETLRFLGFSPSAVVGSKVKNWSGNSLFGESNLFVIEADEHQNKLRYYNPHSIILTNVEYDHPDFYTTEEAYSKAFEDFLTKKIKGESADLLVVMNQDDVKSRKLKAKIKDRKILTYGKSKSADFELKKVEGKVEKNSGFVSQLSFRAKIDPAILPVAMKRAFFGKVKVSLIGEHNAFNALAVIAFLMDFILSRRIKNKLDSKNKALAFWAKEPLPENRAAENKWLGRLLTVIESGLLNFAGTERRLQFKGKVKKTWIFDDYAHHPKEIEVTLKAIKKIFPRHELYVIFQPHTYSRTETFLKEFAIALAKADRVGVLVIYSSAREQKGEISGADLVKLIPKSKKAVYFESHEEALKSLRQEAFSRPRILVTMGAGDGFRVGERLVQSSKFKV